MNHALYKVREFHNFRELLEQSERLYGNSPAFKVKNKIGQIIDISYTRFKEDIEALGTALLSLGLDGAKIAVAGKNSYEWCVSYMAVGCGVGVVVPTDKELPFDDIKSILEVSEAKAIIFDEAFGKKILEHRDLLPKDLIFISIEQKKEENGILSFRELINHGTRLIAQGNRDYLDCDIHGNKMTVLLFTSGTTGMSKAVMLSAENICSDVRSIMGVVKINHGERILSVLPLHHTYECTVTFLCCIYGGVTICFCEGLRYITKNLEEYKPHILIVVPLMLEKFYKRIMKAIEKEKGGAIKIAVGSMINKVTGTVKLDLSDLFFGKIKKAFGGSIRLIISGAAGVDSTMVKNMNKFGIQTFQGYGLTECAPIVICNSDKDNRYDSIGKPIPNVQAKIDNPDENGVGEICIKGPMVMLGYYKDPEATNAAFDLDGWYHTGDLGRVDSEGHYYISGRCKSVIVTTNGKNVYPEELEELLGKEPAVLECMVKAGQDERGNTIVVARIYPDTAAIGAMHGNRDISEKDIRNAVSDAIKKVNLKVVSYKSIRHFELVDKPFEKTTTSKIKRNQ